MEATCRGGYEGGAACATWIDGLRESRARGADELEASAVTEGVYEDTFIMITDCGVVEARHQTPLQPNSSLQRFFRSIAITIRHYPPKYIH